jgi:hypothetical protein
VRWSAQLGALLVNQAARGSHPAVEWNVRRRFPVFSWGNASAFRRPALTSSGDRVLGSLLREAQTEAGAGIGSFGRESKPRKSVPPITSHLAVLFYPRLTIAGANGASAMSLMTLSVTTVRSRRLPKWRQLLAELRQRAVPATS